MRNAPQLIALNSERSVHRSECNVLQCSSSRQPIDLEVVGR